MRWLAGTLLVSNILSGKNYSPHPRIVASPVARKYVGLRYWIDKLWLDIFFKTAYRSNAYLRQSLPRFLEYF